MNTSDSCADRAVVTLTFASGITGGKAYFFRKVNLGSNPIIGFDAEL
jgi:hypothetical protein